MLVHERTGFGALDRFDGDVAQVPTPFPIPPFMQARAIAPAKTAAPAKFSARVEVKDEDTEAFIPGAKVSLFHVPVAWVGPVPIPRLKERKPLSVMFTDIGGNAPFLDVSLPEPGYLHYVVEAPGYTPKAVPAKAGYQTILIAKVKHEAATWPIFVVLGVGLAALLVLQPWKS